MAHALTADHRSGHLDAALITYNSFVADFLVLTAVTLQILRRPEDAFIKQAILLGLLGPVVNGFRFGYFAMGPLADSLRRCQTQPERVEVQCFAFGFIKHRGKNENDYAVEGAAGSSATGSAKSAATGVAWPGFSLRSSMSRHSPLSSRISTLKDSGILILRIGSPLIMDSYAFERPGTSSDLIVRISWSVCAAPYASSAHTSISPKRWPPNWALPPSGCCVISEYGPIERWWILSSTIWLSFII